MLKVWVSKMRSQPKYLNVNKHTKICSEHFKDDDFTEPDAKVKRLKINAVPSIFKWSPEKSEKPRRPLEYKITIYRACPKKVLWFDSS